MAFLPLRRGVLFALMGTAALAQSPTSQKVVHHYPLDHPAVPSALRDAGGPFRVAASDGAIWELAFFTIGGTKITKGIWRLDPKAAHP